MRRERVERKVKGARHIACIKKRRHDRTHAISSARCITHSMHETVTLMSPVTHSTRDHGESFPFNRALSHSPRYKQNTLSARTARLEKENEGKGEEGGEERMREELSLSSRGTQIHRTVRLLNTTPYRPSGIAKRTQDHSQITRTFTDASSRRARTVPLLSSVSTSCHTRSRRVGRQAGSLAG